MQNAVAGQQADGLRRGLLRAVRDGGIAGDISDAARIVRPQIKDRGAVEGGAQLDEREIFLGTREAFLVPVIRDGVVVIAQGVGAAEGCNALVVAGRDLDVRRRADSGFIDDMRGCQHQVGRDQFARGLEVLVADRVGDVDHAVEGRAGGGGHRGQLSQVASRQRRPSLPPLAAAPQITRSGHHVQRRGAGGAVVWAARRTLVRSLRGAEGGDDP